MHLFTYQDLFYYIFHLTTNVTNYKIYIYIVQLERTSLENLHSKEIKLFFPLNWLYLYVASRKVTRAKH